MSKNSKQVSISSIDRVESRAALEPRVAPHWKRVAEGRYVGYRYMTVGRPGRPRSE
jgi:hypothetical protein